MTGIASSRANAHVRKRSEQKREINDFYRTPASSTRALLAVEALPTCLWEPACGDGAISYVLAEAGHRVISTDLIDRGFGETRRDFLFEQNLLAPAVVTNPPFKIADDFVLHALHLGAEKVCMLMRLGWLEGIARYERLWSKHPPIRVWTFCGRQTLWRGDEEQRPGAGGAIAFAWFVWERAFVGHPELRWLSDAEASRTAEATRQTITRPSALPLFAEAAE